jgi:hypothetical protein
MHSYGRTVPRKCNIKGMSEFLSKIDKDPIELLKAIKQDALNYQENRYDMSIVSDSFKTLVHLEQNEGESLRDYTKGLKHPGKCWNLILEVQF